MRAPYRTPHPASDERRPAEGPKSPRAEALVWGGMALVALVRLWALCAGGNYGSAEATVLFGCVAVLAALTLASVRGRG